ncbi:hypothetical protein EVAR_54059_1 [Eumeta japonica]|uniref:Uncharacterized protein n=1 Tax=Eumeta variegata TaxID=151549 RepID=A0A4C1XHS1_EUMVA|nr:hypothetical protein EVAR_54059_1 [Eumeta japonica]
MIPETGADYNEDCCAKHNVVGYGTGKKEERMHLEQKSFYALMHYFYPASHPAPHTDVVRIRNICHTIACHLVFILCNTLKKNIATIVFR